MYIKIVDKVDIKEWEMFEMPDVALIDAATENGSLANSSPELVFQPTDIWRKPAYATDLASVYNDWLLENWLKRSSRKTRHPAYHPGHTKGDHSRCSGR